MTGLTTSHPYPGKLIIVEGIDGSEKSTQIALLHRWLLAQGEKVFFTEWNSSALVRRSLRRVKKFASFWRYLAGERPPRRLRTVRSRPAQSRRRT
jgi:Thymidylate kinase